jgi:putative hydrolase of the HAD superfamily
MTRIRAIIFDMDGVLSTYDFARRLDVLADAVQLPPQQIDERIFASGFDARADEGEFSVDEYMLEFSRLLGVDVPLDAWLEARRVSMTPDREVIGLARELSRQCSVAVLTNNGPVLREHLASVAPEIAAAFGDRIFFSCELGVGKDSPESFRRLLQRLGASPSTTFFVDDTARYVHAAREAGLHATHYRGIGELRAELRRLGLSVGD